mgnify:CR=1 FL=1
MSQVKIGILGCQGRMGKALTMAVLDHPSTQLEGGTEMVGHSDIGMLIKHPGNGDVTTVKITDDAEELIKNSDVIVDFTCPTATLNHASLAVNSKTAMIIGTTGMSDSDEEFLVEVSRQIPVVYCSNYSEGVTLLLHLTTIASAALDNDFDVEVVEMHHRDKVDAPSGTALSIGEAAARGRNVDLKDVMVEARHGMTGARKKGDIGFAVLRGGNVAGEHTVSFNADDERIELTHKAGNRSIFARGAVKAAYWVNNKPSGLYTMTDVLGLNKNGLQ